MGILNVVTDVTGQVGVVPRRVTVWTTDNYATLTGAGYLNNNWIRDQIMPTDEVECIYSYNRSTGSGTYTKLLPSFGSTGVITLVPATDVAVPLIVAGNIQAGFSGTAGTLGSFPATASKGELLVAAVNNSAGNFNTTISNASSVGQSQVVSITDGGASASNFIISKSAGTQHIT